MKKLVLLLFLLPVLAGFGQSTTTTKTCVECSNYDFTSIFQLADVKETDACYIHLQSLVERYGIKVAACNQNIFGGSQLLTNGAMAQMLSSSLQTISELKIAFTFEKSEADKKKIEEKTKLIGFDLFKHQYKSVDEVKDVKASDCYYRDVQILLKDYKIDITDKNGLLQSGKAANGKNAGLLLKQVFGLKNLDVSKYDKPSITKAEFAILLNMALDEYNEMLAAATY